MFAFSDSDFDKIAAVLGVEAKREETLVRFDLRDVDSGRRLSLELYPSLNLPANAAQDKPHNLVSVYATNSFLQLHACTGFVASEEMGEVIFFAKHNGSTNGLIVERGAGCSLYANVDDKTLSLDFTQLPAEIMMSSVALSMTEDLFNL